MRCRRCGRDNPAANHFCTCGEYLAWGDLAERAAEAPTPALPETAQRDESSASLTLANAIGGPAQPGEDLRVAVIPGETAEIVARVRNEGAIVDRFTLTATGLPESWVAIESEAVDLLPVGPRGGFERDVTIRLRPTRTTDAVAGASRLTLAARSESLRREVARAGVDVWVEPFAELSARASPQVASARRRTVISCAVSNTGNTPAAVTVLADDPGDGCRVVVPRTARVERGLVAHLPVEVRVTRPRIVGMPALHTIQLSATTPGLAQPAVAPPVLFRRRPWIPWWVALAVLLLALVAVLVWLLLPRHAVVPSVIGAPSAFAAQKRLEAEGLQAPPKVVAVAAPTVKPQTVVDQSPRGGREVPRDTVVTIRVAAQPGVTTVPRLRGLTTAQADGRLTQANLVLGDVAPRKDPKARIKTQVPAAGAQRKRGTAVDVVLGRRMVKVPRVHGLPLARARRRLRHLGLRLGPVQPKGRTSGKVASQFPPAGTRVPVRRKVKVKLAPRTVLVPDIKGLTVAEVERRLTRCKLVLDPFAEPAPGNVVVGQVPEAGEIRRQGTVIRILVGPKGTFKGEKPEPPASCAPPPPTSPAP